MKCRVCGADIPSDAYFCGECGALVTPGESAEPTPKKTEDTGYQGGTIPQEIPPVPPVPPVQPVPPNPPVNPNLTCRNCGESINPKDEFCQKCGEPVNNNLPPEVLKLSKSSNKGIIIAVAAVYIFIMIIVGVVVLNVLLSGNDTMSTSSVEGTQKNSVSTLAPQPTPYSAGSTSVASTAAGSTGEFLFPSDTQYITDADLAGKTQDEVRLILNEIYARRGYRFSTDYYKNYFSSKSWYTPRTNSQPDVEKSFNAVELANKNFIAAYEQSRGWR